MLTNLFISESNALTCSSLLLSSNQSKVVFSELYIEAEDIYQTEGLIAAIDHLELNLDEDIQSNLLDQRNPDALFYLAKLYKEADQLSMRVKFLAHMGKSFSGVENSIAVSAYSQLADTLESLAARNNDDQLLELAIETRLQVLKLEPNHYHSIRSLIKPLKNMGKLDEALKIASKAYERAIELGYSRAKYSILNHKADLEFKLRKLSEAEDSYLELKTHKHYAEIASERLVDIMLIKGHLESALSFSLMHLSLNGYRSHVAQLQLIDILVKMGDFTEAINTIKAQIDIARLNNHDRYLTSLSAKLEKVERAARFSRFDQI